MGRLLMSLECLLVLINLINPYSVDIVHVLDNVELKAVQILAQNYVFEKFFYLSAAGEHFERLRRPKRSKTLFLHDFYAEN